MTRPAATLLGFDFSNRQIGVAVGQTVTGTARPLANIPVRAKTPDWEVISGLVDSWKPDALVVGLPLDQAGGEQPTSVAARHFRDELHERFGLPTHFADERFTTREAQTRLADAGRGGEPDDAVAAQIILESWISDPGSRA